MQVSSNWNHTCTGLPRNNLPIMLRTALILLLTTLSHLTDAQELTIEGKVVDSESMEPLAFVNVIYGTPSKGTTTDIDGRFSIEISRQVDHVQFSFLGYHKKVVDVDTLTGSPEQPIQMDPRAFRLDEVVIKPGSNPAVPIIKKVYENRER